MDYLRGFIQSTGAGITPGGLYTAPSQRANSYSGSRKQAPSAKAKKYGGESLTFGKVDALEGQGFQFRIIESELEAKKRSYTSRIEDIMTSVYHNDLDAAVGNEEINSMLSELRVGRANLEANRDAISQNATELRAQKKTAFDNNALQDFAVDKYGNRYFINDKGHVDNDPANYKGGGYLTNEMLYEQQEKGLGFTMEKNGMRGTQKVQSLTTFDNNIDYISLDASTWMPKSGHTQESEAAIQGASETGQAYNIITKNGWKSNEKQLGMMANTLANSMGDAVTYQMRQRYWKSGIYNNAIYNVLAFNEDGTPVEKEYIDENGEKQTYSVRINGPIDDEVLKAAKATPPDQRTPQQKEYASVKELDEQTKFGLFAAEEYQKYINPMIKEDYIGNLSLRNIGKGGKAGSDGATTKLNFVESTNEILKAAELAGKGSRKMSIYKRTRPLEVSGNEVTKEAYFRRYDKQATVIELHPDQMKDVLADNLKFRKSFINDEGQYMSMPNGYEIGNLASSVNIFGSIISGNLLDGLYFYSATKDVALMPKVAINSSDGYLDWDDSGQSMAWRGTNIIATGEAFERIMKMLVGDADVSVENGVVSSDNKEDWEYRGTFDPDSAWMMGYDLSEIAKQYGVKIIPSADLTGNDAYIIPAWMINDTSTTALEMTDVAKTGNQEVVSALWGSIESNRSSDKNQNNTNIEARYGK